MPLIPSCMAVDLLKLCTVKNTINVIMSLLRICTKFPIPQGMFLVAEEIEAAAVQPCGRPSWPPVQPHVLHGLPQFTSKADRSAALIKRPL